MLAKVNYKVCRDNVYLGAVVKTNSVYRYEGESDGFGIKTGQLMTGSWRHYRSMLFEPNENGLAKDLLYNSPNYPVLNITDDETCLKISSDTIVIKDACNLGQLLEYFGYNQELTFKDLVTIRKKFFTGRFAIDNCELFGYKESQPKDWIFYENGQKVTDSKKNKKRNRKI